MNIGFFSRHEELNIDNGLFDANKYKIGSGLERPLCLIKDLFEEKNISVNTVKNNDFSPYDIVIFIDFPKDINIITNARKNVKYLLLIAFESDVILPNNFNKQARDLFDVVFTWSDKVISGNEVIIYWPNSIPQNFKINEAYRKKQIVLISSNKISLDDRELYSERIKFINELDGSNLKCDVYGYGWDDRVYRNLFLKIFKYLKLIRYTNILCHYFKPLKYILKYKIPNYKGKTNDKLKTLNNYKFNLCFENAKDIDGYITEKIFDSFFAGTIPIYYGSNKIDKFIPINTYINVTDFNSYHELIMHIESLSDKKIKIFQKNIQNFLLSNKFNRFSAENFACTVFEETLGLTISNN